MKVILPKYRKKGPGNHMEKRFVFVVFSLVIGVVQSVNAEVPAIFVLGDSTSDVGTNNYLPQSTIKANFPHNGIDFPFARATGRFSNGFNTADYLGYYTIYYSSILP